MVAIPDQAQQTTTCPRCKAATYADSDRFGSYVECVYCGWMKDDNADPDAAETYTIAKADSAWSMRIMPEQTPNGPATTLIKTWRGLISWGKSALPADCPPPCGRPRSTNSKGIYCSKHAVMYQKTHRDPPPKIHLPERIGLLEIKYYIKVAKTARMIHPVSSRVAKEALYSEKWWSRSLIRVAAELGLKVWGQAEIRKHADRLPAASMNPVDWHAYSVATHEHEFKQRGSLSVCKSCGVTERLWIQLEGYAKLRQVFA